MAWFDVGSLLLVGHEEHLVRARGEVGALFRLMRARASGHDFAPPLAVVIGRLRLDRDADELCHVHDGKRMFISESFAVNGVWRLCLLASINAGDRSDSCEVRVLLFEALLQEARQHGEPMLFSPAFCEREDLNTVRACMERFLHAPPGCVGTPIMWAA